MAEVARTATQGTWFLFKAEKIFGACLSMASVYSSLVPANKAWFPAESTLVMMTALMKVPAAVEPAIWKTRVNGEVLVSRSLRPLVV